MMVDGASRRTDYAASGRTDYRRPLSTGDNKNAALSAESSPGPKYRSSLAEGTRAEVPRHLQGDDQENRYPRRGGESGDEISDIDARLNALQSFLQQAKAKARAAGGGRAR